MAKEEYKDVKPLPVGTKLMGGKYTINAVIGKGGFGITYRADGEFEMGGNIGGYKTKISVAIKEFFMKSCCDRDEVTEEVSASTKANAETFGIFRRKFKKEASVLSKMNHEGIVNVIDLFDENGTSYYVMNYVEGRTVNQIINTQKAPLPEAKAVEYIRKVGAALEYVHSKNYLHLDVKPDNIIVNTQDQPVLIDFGGAKHYTEDGDTESSTTPPIHSDGYSPAEIYVGLSKFSPEADVYSLAATLYKMLTATTPKKPIEVTNDMFRFRASAPVRYAIWRAMQFRAEERTPSVAAFLADLDANISDEKLNSLLGSPKNSGKSAPSVPPVSQGGAAGAQSDDEDTDFDENTQVNGMPEVNRTFGDNDPGNTYNNNSAEGAKEEKKSRTPMIVLLCVVLALAAGVGSYFAFSSGAGMDEAEQKRFNDSIEIANANERVDSIVKKDFSTGSGFYEKLSLPYDQWDGLMVESCEKIYDSYTTAYNLSIETNPDKTPAEPKELKKEDLNFMCGQLVAYANYWYSATGDASYQDLATKWKDRQAKTAPAASK